ncbi:hypothetical protein QLR68_38755, partial [Micromonospora sp. DH15]|nr:hypothetical protein [Micromonospora sp. DH15]
LWVSQIRITTENSTKTPDGYDVDGVEAVNGCHDVCFASQSVSYGPIGAILAARAHKEYVLGAPYAGTGNNTDFATLGFGGKITVGFGQGLLFMTSLVMIS